MGCGRSALWQRAVLLQRARLAHERVQTLPIGQVPRQLQAQLQFVQVSKNILRFWPNVVGSFDDELPNLLDVGRQVLLLLLVMLLRRLQRRPMRRGKVQTVGVHQLRLGWRLRSVHLWLLVELVPVRFQDI